MLDGSLRGVRSAIERSFMYLDEAKIQEVKRVPLVYPQAGLFQDDDFVFCVVGDNFAA